MCDLWRYTTVTDTPSGAIAAQIASARATLLSEREPVTGIKLYNAGSFFDPRAVPVQDYDAIAESLEGLSRVIVESHPALIASRVNRLMAAFTRCNETSGTAIALEVAMGLETAHPVALDRLNKRFTLEQFTRAARTLAESGIALRVFLLISPPFIADAEQDDWLVRSLDAAFSCAASVVSLVPTRPGNGAMEAFTAAGLFRAPNLEDIERTFTLALTHARGRGRVFIDLWDIDRFTHCACCRAPRRDRLQAMNLGQRVLPTVSCTSAVAHS